MIPAATLSELEATDTAAAEEIQEAVAETVGVTVTVLNVVTSPLLEDAMAEVAAAAEVAIEEEDATTLAATATLLAAVVEVATAATEVAVVAADTLPAPQVATTPPGAVYVAISKP